MKGSVKNLEPRAIFFSKQGVAGLLTRTGPCPTQDLTEAWVRDTCLHRPRGFTLAVDTDGYTSPAPMPMWSKHLPLCQVRGKKQFCGNILVCGKVESTMDAAHKLFKQGKLFYGDSLMALSQTKGRGQGGRLWCSDPGNLYATWIIPEKEGWNHVVSLFAGYVVTIVLRELGVKVMLKWPNDLLVCGKKVGGILTESKHGYHTVGVGINTEHAPDQSFLRDEFAFPAVSLKDCGTNIGPLSLWLRIVEKGNRLWDQWTRALRPQDMICLAEKYMAFIGEKIIAHISGCETISGILLGMADDGALMVREKATTRVIYHGSILSH